MLVFLAFFFRGSVDGASRGWAGVLSGFAVFWSRYEYVIYANNCDYGVVIVYDHVRSLDVGRVNGYPMGFDFVL